ncbi:hypothetical protein, partial [Enterococcus casseliflavus]|uniref:GspE/PulE/PilB domain-containing protein n=1 Tax=Enterococcus casseliflavus TaxID=37734 RepID=UPI003D0DD3E5
FDVALANADSRGLTLVRVLIEERLISETDLVSTIASHMGLLFVDLSEHPIDAGAARLINDTVARRYMAIPIGWEQGQLLVAMADPSNVV